MGSILPASTGAWEVVNDDVMGGCSRAAMVAVAEHLSFQGEISLANGGGFASVRAPLAERLDGARGLRMQVCGDGRRYQIRLRADTDPNSIAYRRVFDTREVWQTLSLDLAAFEPVFRGRRVEPLTPLVSGDMLWVGFMTAEKRAGGFRLDIGACVPIL